MKDACLWYFTLALLANTVLYGVYLSMFIVPFVSVSLSKSLRWLGCYRRQKTRTGIIITKKPYLDTFIFVMFTTIDAIFLLCED